LVIEVSSSLECVIEQVPLERPSEVKVLIKNEFCNDRPAISPDGHWIAYHSNLSGRQEIYAERYPELGDRQQISTGGGVRPLWSHDGRELFFTTPDNRQVISVSMLSGSSVLAGRPHDLFELSVAPTGGGNRPVDLAPDGRFLFISGGPTGSDGLPSSIILVQNWTEELKRLVPTH